MSLEDLKDSLVETYGSLNESIPYFPYILGLIVLVIISGGLFLVLGGGEEGATTVSFEVKNQSGIGLRGAKINLVGPDKELTLLTDKEGKISAQLLIDSDYEATISKDNYLEEKKFFVVTEGEKLSIILNRPITISKERVITFVGKDNKKISGKTITAQLSCSGSGVFEQTTYITTTGELIIEPPQNCGTVQVTASADGFGTIKSTITGKEQVLLLQSLSSPTGQVEITIKDVETQRFIEGIKVKLLDSFDMLHSEMFTSFGEVRFNNVEAGEYSAIIEDTQGDYGIKRIELSLSGTEIVKKTVLLSKDVKINAEIIVSDKLSNTEISNATVTLYDSSEQILAQKETNPEGEVIFTITENGTYSYLASKEEYLPSERNIFNTEDYSKGSTQTFETELEKCTPETCGALIIQVVDEEEVAIENAKVVLVDEDGFIETAYGYRFTDSEGFTPPVSNVAEGTYSALAQKYPGEGKSESFEIDPNKPTTVKMIMEIGAGIISINVKNAEGDSIEFAEAEIFTDYGASLGTVSIGANGEGELENVKADKKVYAVVKKDDYTTYFTSSRQVFKNEKIEFDVVLEKEILGTKPKIKLLGVYSKFDRDVSQLEAGSVYLAKFLITVPTDADLDELGAFLRIGEENKLEKDRIWFSEINTQNASEIRGKTYNPPIGEAKITNNNAKWVSLKWNDPEPGIYELEAEIRVHQGTITETYLPLHYRVWGRDGSSYLRDPVDKELNEAEETPNKLAIYAEPYTKPFYEGMDELCYDDFCFGERLLDETEGIFIEYPYDVKTFSPYALSFSITNNSKILHDNAELKIFNSSDGTGISEEVSITSYTITNADSQEFSSGTPLFEIDDIPLGEFRQNKTISGELLLEPKTINSSELIFKIISDQQIVFEENLFFFPFFVKNIELNVEPELIISNVPTDLIVNVTYLTGDKAGFGINEAKVIVTSLSSLGEETEFVATTDFNGTAKIQLPSYNSGTKLFISAEKAGLGAKTIEKEISYQAVIFSPEKINNTVSKTNEDSTSMLSITNQSGTDLTIKKIKTTGRFIGLLNEEKMDNFLAGYIGITIPQNEKAAVEVLSSFGEEANYLETEKTVELDLLIEVSPKSNPEVTWVFEVPFDTKIQLGELPSNDSCLVISQTNWEESTINSQVSIEFELQNNCTTGSGEFIEFDYLVGTMNWVGVDGIIGNVELTITNPETGETSSEILQQGIWSKLLSNIEHGTNYVGRLNFIAKPLSEGKRAEFSINIDGEIKTSAGLTLAGSGGTINGDILIVNLENCIQSSIGEGGPPSLDLGIENSGVFTLDATECGNLKVNVRLCHDDSGCKGGSEEGGIIVNPLTFEFKQGRTTQEITVNRETIPGIYGIGIEAKPEGGSWRGIGEVLVTLAPEGSAGGYANPFGTGTGGYTQSLFSDAGSYGHSGEPFTLSKYDFVVKGIGAKDIATLTNRLLSETVPVDASACDWGTASELEEEGAFDMGTAGLGAAAGGLMGAKPALAAAKNATMEAGKKAGKAIKQGLNQSEEVLDKGKAAVDKVDDLEKARDTMNKTKEATDKTLESLDTAVSGTVMTGANAVQTACVGPGATPCTASTAASGVTAANKALGKSKDKAFEQISDISDTVNKANELGDNALKLSEQADGTLGTASETAMPKTGGSIPTGCADAQEGLSTSLDTAKDSLKDSKELTKELTDAKDVAKKGAKKAVKKVSTDLTATKAKVKAVQTAIAGCKVIPLPHGANSAAVAACNLAKKAVGPAIEGVVNSEIAEAADSISELKDTVSEVGNAAKTAGNASDKLIDNQDKLNSNIDSMQSECAEFTDVSAATGEAADFSWGKFGGIMALYPGLGFVGGGFIGQLFDGQENNPCDQRVTQDVQDWVINLAPGINENVSDGGLGGLGNIMDILQNPQNLLSTLTSSVNSGDALPVSSDNSGIKGKWDFSDVKSLGQFDQQQVGVIFENIGIDDNSSQVYSVINFPALKHTHAKPTTIPEGNGNFGQFNVPDMMVVPVNQKFHLRFQTGENKETITNVEFDAESCIVGNRIGYTGKDVTPKVLLKWDWDNFKNYPCDDTTEDYVYCDATQFNMEINYKLNILRKFLELNHLQLTCPANPAEDILNDLTSELNALDLYDLAFTNEACWLPYSTVMVDGRPSLDYFIEGKESSIQWLPEEGISNREDLQNLLTFNSYLIKDGFSEDFITDFEDYYSTKAFFNTPALFNSLFNSNSEKTGFNSYYTDKRIIFHKKYNVDDYSLSSPGLYRVHLKLDLDGGNWQLFSQDGDPTANIYVQLSLLEEPKFNSPFYNIPFDGLVGIENRIYHRNGYGSAYENESTFLTINDSADAVKSYPDSGSNAIAKINVNINKDIYNLNTSPETRGMLLKLDNSRVQTKEIIFQPIQATPIIMKIPYSENEEELSVYYSLLEEDVPADVGNTLNYWSGAGNCYDFSNELVTEAFNETPDRASTEKDSLLDWQNLYALDWSNINEKGEVYLRTIIYTDPLRNSTIVAKNGPSGFSFISSDSHGEKINLKGVSGMPYNNNADGSLGTIDSIRDVFKLVKSSDVCITNSGTTTKFWWNPKSIYTSQGTEISVSDFTTELEAGTTCIG